MSKEPLCRCEKAAEWLYVMQDPLMTTVAILPETPRVPRRLPACHPV
jgi:hypothetical protein